MHSNYASLCVSGKRKPDTEFYNEVVRHLNVDPTNCIFVDDRFSLSLYTASLIKIKPQYLSGDRPF